MGSRIQRLKTWSSNFLANVLTVLIVVGFVGLIVFIWWLERVRFVW